MFYYKVYFAKFNQFDCEVWAQSLIEHNLDLKFCIIKLGSPTKYLSKCFWCTVH